MKEGWRRRRSRGTVGSLRPNTRLRNRPPPPLPPPKPLITHTGTIEPTFPGFSHGTGRRERDRPEGWRRRGRKKRDGGLALKPGSDHHYRGAIVLRPSHPFSYEGASRGGGAGAGRHRNWRVGGGLEGGGGGGLRYAGSHPPSTPPHQPVG